MAFWWYFTPDAADIEQCRGFECPCASGNEVIRWETIDKYLRDLGFSQQVGKDSYIPENIFYRLAMKAKNETAEKFQVLVGLRFPFILCPVQDALQRFFSHVDCFDVVQLYHYDFSNVQPESPHCCVFIIH